MGQKTVCFLLPGHESIREKWSNAAWKSYESELFHCSTALASSTGSSLASKREIYESEMRSDIRQTTSRTLQGYEVMNMIRKGQVQGVAKGDIRGQIALVAKL